jgi:hypothetical protein
MQPQNGDHPQEELTKFGYKSEKKESFLKRILSYFGNLLEPII